MRMASAPLGGTERATPMLGFLRGVGGNGVERSKQTYGGRRESAPPASEPRLPCLTLIAMTEYWRSMKCTDIFSG